MNDNINYKLLYEEKCKECELLQVKIKLIDEQNPGQYEKFIYDIVKNTKINNIPFNISSQLGGSSKNNDLTCFYNVSFGIEIKKYKAPDWIQCSLKYDKCWKVSATSQLPIKAQKIFEKLINNINLYNNNIPPFLSKNITHEEWLNIKKNNVWKNVYLDIENDTIKNLYEIKGCKYIQVSEYGLYHLGVDICHFNVPEFIVPQHLRIRIKVHKRKTSLGFCTLSVTASCQPKNIKLLLKSPYSLDIKIRCHQI
jgi:hypothetical protein